MQYIIIAVGRWRASPEKALYEKFQTRIRPTPKLREVEEKKRLKGQTLLYREGQLLLDAIPDQARVVALDGGGVAFSSPGLASKLGTWRDDGVREVAFLVGGARGHDPMVFERADLTLSLGPQTWPHMMVRVMLAEQLYRAQSILVGHPYHRD